MEFLLLVMRDIVSQMLDSRCVNEIFRPQKVLTKKSLRTVFERLAHASIMKLNSSAMEKVRVCVCVCVCPSVQSVHVMYMCMYKTYRLTGL